MEKFRDNEEHLKVEVQKVEDLALSNKLKTEEIEKLK